MSQIKTEFASSATVGLPPDSRSDSAGFSPCPTHKTLRVDGHCTDCHVESAHSIDGSWIAKLESAAQAKGLRTVVWREAGYWHLKVYPPEYLASQRNHVLGCLCKECR